MKKQFIASSYLKKISITLFIITLIIITFFKFGYKKYLIISNQETKEIYMDIRVEKGDIVQYSWIHSFEHIPWTEDFIIQGNNSLMLNKITVAGYGAGIPENKGKVTIENGIIIMREMNQSFKEINWINSNTALSFISINGNKLIKGKDLPHHEPLNLIVKEKFTIWTRFH